MDESVKRVKSNAAAIATTDTLPSALFGEVISGENIEDCKTPFPHLIWTNVLPKQTVHSMRRELAALEAELKETDILKYVQTQDLQKVMIANADHAPTSTTAGGSTTPDAAAAASAFSSFRDALCGADFRSFVEKQLGLPAGKLVDRVDLSANVYGQGHHLLCHDDVIGTRQVSFIMYLTDESVLPWRKQDGGAFELFANENECVSDQDDVADDVTDDVTGEPDSNEDNNNHVDPTVRPRPTPGTIPRKLILPHGNTMVMFTVEAGQSLHAVQEVYSPDHCRLSIQGWFHASDEPPAHHKVAATLSDLQCRDDPSASAFALQHASKSTSKTSPSDATKSQRDGDDDVSVAVAAPLRCDVQHDGCARPTLAARWPQLVRELTASPSSSLSPVASPKDTLSDADKAVLREWVQPKWLSDVGRQKLRRLHYNEPQRLLQVPQFLKALKWQDIARQLRATDRVDQLHRGYENTTAPSYRAGLNHAHWFGVGPAHRQRFLKYCASTRSEGDRAGIGFLLHECLETLFMHEAFWRWLQWVVGDNDAWLGQCFPRQDQGDQRPTRKPPALLQAVVRRFRPGLDYIVAQQSDTSADRRRLHVVWTCVGDDQDCVDAFESGAVGGYDCFTQPDSSQDAKDAEVYKAQQPRKQHDGTATDMTNANDDDEVRSLVALPNTLSIVAVQPGEAHFVKYVAGQAPSSRFEVRVVTEEA